MVFDFFKKRRQSDDLSQQFAYFSSQKEMAGIEAVPLKQALEARLESLTEKAKISPLSEAEIQEQKDISSQIQSLLQSGQLSQQMAASLAISQSGPADLQEWTDTSHKRYRILVVEDDPDLAEMLRFCLDRVFKEVIVLSDGRDAESWIQSHPPVDIVSLDLMLPRSNGFRLLQLIRQTPGWEKVPVLVASSKSDSETIQSALLAGANEYLQKPIQPQTYIARLQKMISGSQ